MISRRDFFYHLPEQLIAKEPLSERSASRLLVLPEHGPLAHWHIIDLPKLLNPGDLLVINDTRVIKARLHGQKSSGGQIEMLIERIQDSHQARAMIRASKAPKIGQTLLMTEAAIEVQVIDRLDNLFIVRFSQPIADVLEQYGELPLPPYMERQANHTDESRYQTIYSNKLHTSSAAAPTAGLHLDHHILGALKTRGIQIANVTLHIGAGTFSPVKADNIEDHMMHYEWADVPPQTVEAIYQTKAVGGKVIAVGTTSTRALESAAMAHGGRLKAWQGETNIFIYPGYHFHVVDRLLTNFHLPESTLLMLVSALAGRKKILAAYAEAIHFEYRFFSYGDAMLIDTHRLTP